MHGLGRVGACVLVLAGAVCTAGGAGVEFLPLGDLPGGPSRSSALAASADGSVVVGLAWSTDGLEAFRWTQATGLQPLGDLPGGGFGSRATAVSADGSTIVGLSTTSRGDEGFRWTEEDGLLKLLSDESALNAPQGISGDGSTVVGTWYGTPRQAFRAAGPWSAAGAPHETLPDLEGGGERANAIDVSSDGSVIVGVSESELGDEAFRWTAGEGTVALGYLDGGTRSQAQAVSAEGNIVVGWSWVLGGTEAFRWTQAEGMVGLGDLPGGEFRSIATDVSADGKRIVGVSKSGLANQFEAFLWQAEMGMQGLRGLLLTYYEVDVSAWRFGPDCDIAISDDGQTIVGSGYNPDGEEEAFVLRLPTPGDANGDGAVTDADYTAWADHYGRSGRGHPIGDANLDGAVTDADYTAWADHYGATLGDGATGDFNGDGSVTDADYTAWADHYDVTGVTWSQGDFSGDGAVTDADYTAWADHYGGFPGAGTAPEPAGALPLLLGISGFLRRRRPLRRA